MYYTHYSWFVTQLKCSQSPVPYHHGSSIDVGNREQQANGEVSVVCIRRYLWNPTRFLRLGWQQYYSALTAALLLSPLLNQGDQDYGTFRCMLSAFRSTTQGCADTLDFFVIEQREFRRNCCEYSLHLMLDHWIIYFFYLSYIS
jgi:hypothetical protein